MKDIVFDIVTPQIDFDVGTPQVEIDVGNAVIGAGTPYSGEYEATPTQSTQVFETKDKVMTSNFVVNPIPSNYGLITYNGYDITVS